MQISTFTKDYVIDTIRLRSEIPNLLSIFANPQIVKVFHGSEKDIVWLQRDFGIYVVNLLDTYQLAVGIRSNNSYGNLLQDYLGVVTDKSLQKADWRIRPLSMEMIKYARTDTHYLLEICRRLLEDFSKFAQMSGRSPQDLFEECFERCKQLSLRVYRKPQTYSESYYKLFKKYDFSREQGEFLKKLWGWRNQLARSLDESEAYILKNSILILLVRREQEASKYLEGEAQTNPNKGNIF